MDREKMMIIAAVTAAVVVCLAATYIMYDDGEEGTDDRIVVDGIHYRITGDGTAEVAMCFAKGDVIDIPATVEKDGREYLVTCISSSSMAFCSAKTVNMPDTVSVIADSAFVFSTVEHIELPDSVRVIGARAFLGCHSLTSVYIPGGVSDMGEGVFAYCDALTDMTVDGDNPVYVYAEGMLVDRAEQTLMFVSPSLTKLDIPEFKGIGSLALTSARLVTVTVPSTVVVIGDEALDSRTLTRIDVDPENPVFSSVDGVLFDDDGCRLLKCPMARSGAYTVPDTVSTIATDAFYGCSEMTSVVIPASVKAIERSAFYECSSLTEVTIADGDMDIDRTAFRGMQFYGSADSTLPLQMDELPGYTYRGVDGKMVRV